MFILEGFRTIVKFEVQAECKEIGLFTTSFMGAIIQDRGKRERNDISDDYVHQKSTWKK